MKMRFKWFPRVALVAGGVCLMLAAGCGPKQDVYYVKGVVKELKPDGRTAVIEHEEVPNYMPKMTMPFGVKDAKELAGLQPEDAVHFRMIVTKDDAWIDQVTKLGRAGAASRTSTSLTNTTPVPRTRLVRDVEPLKVGDAMPDYPFTTELGQPLRLAELKGQAYAFTFIFTRCPLPLFCMRMTEQFAAAARKLAARKDGPDNWRLLSFTFDVEYDSPAVLHSYAKRYNYDPKRWSFLTGQIIEIDAISEQFGLYYARSEGGAVNFDHNLRTVVVDATGKIQHIFIGNEWKADELVEELVKAAGAK